MRETFDPGTRVEVRVGGRWRPGVVRFYEPSIGEYAVDLTGPSTAAIAVQRAHVRAARGRAPRQRPPVATATAPRTLAVADLRPVPKPTSRLRSDAYLAFVRRHPCASCGTPAPSDASHHGRRGVGQKADDVLAVSLCRGCHEVYERTKIVPGAARWLAELGVRLVGRDSPEHDRRVVLAFVEAWLARVQRDLLVEWLRAQGA